VDNTTAVLVEVRGGGRNTHIYRQINREQTYGIRIESETAT